jgi:tetratricopeptide (TPR) repeat protein/predicted nucleic acid-binding protein
LVQSYKEDWIGLIQVASGKPGKPPLKANSPKVKKTIKNSALSDLQLPGQFQRFGLLSSLGFYEESKTATNLSYILTSCHEHLKIGAALPDSVSLWVDETVKEFREDPQFSSYTSANLILLLSKFHLHQGPALDYEKYETVNQLKVLPKVKERRLSIDEIELLAEHLLIPFREAIDATIRHGRQEFSIFVPDAKNRTTHWLYEIKRFDRARMEDLLQEGIHSVLARRTFEPLKTVEQADPSREEFVGLKPISDSRYQVSSYFLKSQPGVLTTPTLQTGMVLQVETVSWTFLDEATQQLSAIISKAKERLEALNPKEAKGLLDEIRELVATTNNSTLRFRWHTNYGAAFELEGNFPHATTHLLEALRFQPDNVKALCNASYAYILREDLAQAETYARAAIAKEPDSAAAYACLIAATGPNVPMDEVLAQIPTRLRQSEEVCYALGCRAKESGELELARKCFEESRTHSSSVGIKLGVQLGEVLLRLAAREHEQIIFGIAAEKTKRLIDESWELLTTAWNIVGDTPYADQFEPVLVNIIFASRLSLARDRRQYAYDKTDAYLEQKTGGEQIRKAAGLLEIERGNLKKALEHFSTISAPSDFELLILLGDVAHHLSNKKVYRDAVKQLLRHAEDSVRVAALRMVFSHQAEHGRLRSAERIMKRLMQVAGDDVDNLLLSAQLSRLKGDRKKAQSVLQTLETKAPSVKRILQMTEEYANLDLPMEGVRLLEQVSNLSEDGVLTRRAACLLYQAGNLGRARTLCESVLKNSKNPVFYNSLLASIFTEVHDLLAAANCYEECLEQTEHRQSLEIRLAFTHLRQGRVDAVDSFLDSKIDAQTLDSSDVALTSRLYLARRRPIGALIVVYNARRYRSAVELDRLYAATFFNIPKDGSIPWLDVDRIGADSAFLIEGTDGGRRWLIVESGPHPAEEKNEISLDDPFFHRVIGCKKEDVVEAPNRFVTERFTVREVISKYVLCYRECLPTIAVEAIKSSDPEEVRKEIEADLLERRNVGIKLEVAYAAVQITLEQLSEASTADYYDVWRCFGTAADRRILCSDGTDEEISSGRENIRISGKVVLDLSSAMALQAVPEARRSLMSLCSQPIVPQSVIDEIESMIFVRRGPKAAGYAIMSKVGEETVWHQVTKESIAFDAEFLVEGLSWLREHCSVVPCDEYLEMDRNFRQQLEQRLGRCAAEAILISKRHKAVLYTDDLCTRAQGANALGVKTVWSEALMLYGRDKGVLSDEELVSGRATLCSLNYFYVRVDKNVLLELAERSGWTSSFAFRQTCSMLDEPTTYDSGIPVIAGFLFDLFGRFIDFNQRMKLADDALEAATRSRNKAWVYGTLSKACDALPLANFGRQNSMRRAIERWATMTGFREGLR